MKQKKRAKYKQFRKEKIQSPTKSKSPTKSPTSKQNDNSDDFLQHLQVKSIESKILLDDISQVDEDMFGPDIKDALAKEVEPRWQNKLSGVKLKKLS